MPHKRIALLSVLAVLMLSATWAQDVSRGPQQGSAAPEPEAPPTPAEVALDEAIAKLQALETYAAEIQMNADMLGQVFQIVGQTSRKPGNRLFMRLAVQGLGDASGLLQRTCDGTTLWEYLRILDNPSLRAVQIAPIMRTLQKPEADAEFRERILTQIGFTGADSLIAGLRKSGRFDQIAEETYGDRPVWVIRGLWTDRVASGMPAGSAGADRTGFLPRYVPSYLALWIDKETGWPHRVLLQGKVPQRFREESVLDPTGRSVRRKSASVGDKPSELDITIKRLDREVTDDEFLFQPPPNVNVIDETERRASDVENALIEFATRKRTEAAARSGEVLDQSLPAPAPNPGDAQPSKPVIDGANGGAGLDNSATPAR